ncbi:protoporphyrinogen oxidase [Paraliobacillus ryukyuensis]|uniref:Coproporphyrinogen III oxidase n=1 Tax=Paraliobacillus ryukyuensis TaxID=200904 RepID=A0A366E9V5_9BACI|nr:protoporphyrinogen oxidase [Paraliobacillus ryukyuensis]RBO98244.1 protoporphyrinogen oxidase [Paraliobacillus ryukyuensis]
MMTTKEIVIVGGGITGLTTAYYLQEAIKDNQLPYKVTLIEASDKLGGKIETVKKQGFTIERGPDSFLIRKEAAARLARRIGLEDQLVKNNTGKSFVLVGESLHEIPKGSFMGIPTKLSPFMLSKMFSLKGKLRMLRDLSISKKEAQSDQSVGEFFRYHFGNELLEHLIEPLLSGIYAGDIDQLSLMATFPQFYQMEQEYSSLIKASRQTMGQKDKKTAKKSSKFYSLKDGLESLVTQVKNQFDSSIVQVLTTTKVNHIEKKPVGYHLLLDNGEVLTADSVALTTSVKQAQRMFSQYDFWEQFGEMKATSVANVAMAFDQAAIPTDIDGTGFVVSRNSDYRITACTWTHKKWPTTTPENKALLRCYVGKPGDEEVVNLTDEEIVAIALKDLEKIMGITAKPDFHVVTRWRDSMPQYTVGHLERLETLSHDLDDQLPGVFVAGNSYRGIGLPDCIRQGEQVVDQIITFLDDEKR